MKSFLLIALLSCTLLAAIDTAAYRSDIRFYPGGKIRGIETKQTGWIDTAVLPVVSIGAGIQTVTINAGSGAIGVFDMLTPVNVTLNLAQRIYIQPGRNPFEICLWAPALGFLLQKRPDAGLTFGINLTAYAIKINGFCFGIGVAWVNEDRMQLNRNRVFIAIPLTYTFEFGR